MGGGVLPTARGSSRFTADSSRIISLSLFHCPTLLSLSPFSVSRLIRLFLVAQSLALLKAETGTYFTPQRDVYATYSTWLLSFTTDLQPHENSMTNFRRTVDSVESAVVSILKGPSSAGLSKEQQQHYEVLANQTVSFVNAELLNSDLRPPDCTLAGSS